MTNRQHVLVMPADLLKALRCRLLEDAPLESAAFLLARPVRTPSGAWRLLGYALMDVAPDEYAVRTPVALELPPAVVARVLQRARVETSAVVMVHSHPFASTAVPSIRDREGEARLLPAFRRRVPDIPHGRLIVAWRGVHAALFEPSGEEAPLTVQGVGTYLETHRPDASDQDAVPAKFDRQVRAFGEEGQRRLRGLRVGIVGLGGTGSIVAEQLAHLGVGAFLLVDPDIVEETNLNRVVGTRHSDIGRAKVAVARDLIMSIDPEARVDALQEDVRDATTTRKLLDVDALLICTDSQGSRAVLTQLSYQYLLPAIDLGVVIHPTQDSMMHVDGRVQMLAPGLPCLVCAEVLDPETVRRDLLTEEARRADPYIVGATVPQPAVISINGVVASMAVTMLLSAVLGVPYHTRHQQVRLHVGWVRPVVASPRPGCPICSTQGAYARGDTWGMPGRLA